MNIVQLFNSFNKGGSEILIVDLLSNYSENLGKQNLVISKGGELEQKAREATTENRVVKIPRTYLSLSFLNNFRKFIKTNEIQIIHAHNPLDVILGKISTLNLKVKIVYSIHGYHVNQSYLSKIIKKIALHYSDIRLFVSVALHMDYKKTFKFPDPSLVLYNGVDKDKLNIIGESVIKEFEFNKCGIFAGMIGNFNDVRDHLTICIALKKVIQKYKNFHFIFVGNDQGLGFEYECKKYCQDHDLADHVHFIGTRSDVPEILASLDMFVYSSNRDTFGIAVVEAMMSGTPVIVNDLPVFEEITDNGSYAQLYKTKDVDDLASKIDYYIKHPDERKKLGKKGKKWALENFTIEEHIKKLHEIYREVLAQ